MYILQKVITEYIIWDLDGFSKIFAINCTPLLLTTTKMG